MTLKILFICQNNSKRPNTFVVHKLASTGVRESFKIFMNIYNVTHYKTVQLLLDIWMIMCKVSQSLQPTRATLSIIHRLIIASKAEVFHKDYLENTSLKTRQSRENVLLSCHYCTRYMLLSFVKIGEYIVSFPVTCLHDLIKSP